MKKILVVDDDKELADLNKCLFELEGFEVAAVNSANEALRFLEKNNVNIIISDVRMPGGDGLYLFEKALDSFLLEGIDFYLYTGYSDFSRDEVIKKGIKDVFYKPLKHEEICKKIK